MSTILGLLHQSTVGSVQELRQASGSSSLAQCLVDGNFSKVLQDTYIQSLLLPPSTNGGSTPEAYSAAEFYGDLRSRGASCVQQALSEGDGRVLEGLLTAGASCLNVFAQHNLTGPYEPEDPSPLQLLAPHLACLPAMPATQSAPSMPATTPSMLPSASSPVSLPTDASSTAADKAEEELTHPHECMAAEQLAVDGEDLVTRKISHLQYLLLSEALLVGPLLSAPASSAAPQANGDSAQTAAGSSQQGDGTATGAILQHDLQGPISPQACQSMSGRGGVTGGSWLWWALRVTCVHQHVLAGRSATLLARTNMLTKQLLASITSPPPLTEPQPVPPSAAPFAPAQASIAAGAPKDLTKAGAMNGINKNGTACPALGNWPQTLHSQPSLHACLLLEMALGQNSYGFVEQGHKLLNEAGTVLGLQVQLSGALGRRTVYQEDAKAQLVVRASRGRQLPATDQDPAVNTFGFEPIYQPQAAGPQSHAAAGNNSSSSNDLGESKAVARQPTHGMVDESDVFMAPKLVAEDGQVLEPRYSATEQALLLAWATHVKKGTAQDELQLWEMAPYVEAVLSQPRSHMMLQATARLLKARHERTRNRTRERALLHMEQLLEALAAHPPPISPEPGTASQPQEAHTPPALRQGASSASAACTGSLSAASEAGRGGRTSGQQDASTSGACALTNTHLPYAYGCWFPLRAQLRKELAEHYMSMGFVGAALGIYEDLQLWDALVVCYRLLEKRGTAEDLLRRRLKVTPDDPVIWCNLGDLYMEDSYYEEAWKRSGCRHGRSKRSLGRSALRRKDYAGAAAHFEEALAINPLNPDAWFSQGYAYLKLGEQRKALRALTSVTQQVPDHAEAWNNVAALWLELGEPKRAYSALGECLRYKRDSWQIWENYAQVAQQAGFPLQATRALAQVLQLSAGTRLHMPVLRQLVQAVEDTLQGKSTTGAMADSAASTGVGSKIVADNGELEDGEDDLAGFVLDIPSSVGLLPWAGGGNGDGGKEGGDAALPYPTKSAYQAGIEAAQQRTEEHMCTAVGKVLKEAVNLPCCTPEVWGLLGRYYSLNGQPEGSKEALIKQVRALSGSAAFKSDETRFVEVADASLALAQAYLQLYCSALPTQMPSSPPMADDVQSGSSTGAQVSDSFAQRQEAEPAPASLAPSTASAAASPVPVQPGSIRELAAARMHLRGVLKQCEPVFGEHEKWQALSAACAEITSVETEAKSLLHAAG